jgi:hypothetical protein
MSCGIAQSPRPHNLPPRAFVLAIPLRFKAGQAASQFGEDLKRLDLPRLS